MSGGQGASTVTAARAFAGAPDQACAVQATGPTSVIATTGSAHSTASPCTTAEAQASPCRTDSGSRPARTAANRAIPHAR